MTIATIHFSCYGPSLKLERTRVPTTRNNAKRHDVYDAVAVAGCMKVRTLYNLVGPQVRRFRCERNWSQEELAEKLHEMGWNICRQRIARIEGGQTWVSDIEHCLLAKLFGKGMEDFLPRMDDSESIYIVLSQLTGKLKMVMSPDEILEHRSKGLLNGHEFLS